MLARQEHSTSPLHVVSQAASTSPEDQPWRPETVKSGLTPKRPRCLVENDEYEAFTRRILRACVRRVGGGDVEALALMLGLAEEVDTAIAEAVKGLRARGYSWADIGARLGITRQAAQQRWAVLQRSCRLRGGGPTVTRTVTATGLDGAEPLRRGETVSIPRNAHVELFDSMSEYSGSNPAPATKARGPFSNRERASGMWFANGFVRWLCSPRPAVLPVRAFRAWRARTTRALSVARLLRSGCGSLRGGYLRSLRHTELGQYRRDVVVDCLW